MNTKKARTDIICYAVLLLAGAVVYFWVIPSQIYLNSSAKAEAFSPDTFPKFVVVVFLLAAAGGLLNAVRLYRKALTEQAARDGGEEALPRANRLLVELIPYIIFLITLGYGILFYKFGFVVSAVVVVPVILLVTKCRKWHYYLIVYAFVALLYLLFRYILHVPIR